MGKLTVLKIQNLTEPGQYGDGDCLYLQVKRDDQNRLSRSWVYRFKLNGKRREMGLGPLHLVSLAEARLKVLACRKMHLEGIDPIETRRAKREQEALERTNAMTFKVCAEKYIASHKAGWKNDKHAAQWPSSLNAYAYPTLGALPAHRIDTALMMRVLEPIWSSKPETASRLRGRIELVLDWARVHGYHKGKNPARWRGHLDKLLPPRSRVKRRRHHAALPYDELPAFMARLRQEDGVAARALEFLILTAARTGEVIGATPDEIKDGVWTVPAERMKAGLEHRVPLSAPAQAVAKAMTEFGAPYLFPGRNLNAPLSNMAMLKLLARIGRTDLTAHGFRSTFKDWASETTDHPPEVSEMALAHAINNDVEAAYRRGDLFRKRAALIDDWAAFCDSGARSENLRLRLDGL
jgi:integrase